VTLINRAHAQKDQCWVDRSDGIQTRPAITAKGMQALRPILGDFNVGLRPAARKAERSEWCGGVYTECRARECQAVGAVAQDDLRSIHLGSELDVAAVASFCNSHFLISCDDVTAIDAQRLR
jgi:hypothetical protein